MHSIPGWLIVSDSRRAEDGAVNNTKVNNNKELALLAAARAGDGSAQERLLTPYEPSLRRLCYGVLGHQEDAEDAVQETFLRALRSLARFRGASGFQTWLFRIALNVCLDWKSARQTRASYPDASLDIAHHETPEAVVMREWQILSALETLSPERRALLMLKELEGWSIGEIAAALQCREKRVHNELYQARRALAAWRQRAAQEDDNVR